MKTYKIKRSFVIEVKADNMYNAVHEADHELLNLIEYYIASFKEVRNTIDIIKNSGFGESAFKTEAGQLYILFKLFFNETNIKEESY